MKCFLVRAVSLLLLLVSPGFALGADLRLPTPKVATQTITLQAGGKPVQVPVRANRLDIVRSAEVVKKVNNRDVAVPSTEVGVKPLSPTAQCKLPGCRIIRVTAGKSASGAYQVRLKDPRNMVIQTVEVNVLAPKATLPSASIATPPAGENGAATSPPGAALSPALSSSAPAGKQLPSPDTVLSQSPTAVRPTSKALPLKILKTLAKAVKIEIKPVASPELVRNQVLDALARQPQFPKAFTRFPIAAQPLSSNNQNLLTALIGKRLSYSDLMKLGLNREKLIGLSFTAINLHYHNIAEADYQRTLAATKDPIQRTELTAKWNQYHREFVSFLNSSGLRKVSEATLKNWMSTLKVSPLSSQLQQVVAKGKRPATLIQGSIGVRIAPSPFTPAPVMTESSSSSDLCSQPLASSSYGYAYHVSWDWTVDIPYWCPTWRHPRRWCSAEVTLFTFELDLEFTVGYEITCLGGTAWAYGSASTTIQHITLSCEAGGSAVIGAGTAGSGGGCVYGFGINVYIGCDVMGISFGYPFPLGGFVINAPCPETISEISSIGEAVSVISRVSTSYVNPPQPIREPIRDVLYLAYQSYFAIVGSGVSTYKLPGYVIATLGPYFGEALLREVKVGESAHTSSTSSNPNAMTDCMTIYFPSGSGVLSLMNNGSIFAKRAGGAFVNSDQLRWLLHELQHTHQCEDVGGRRDYAIRWFSELSSTMIQDLITNPRSVNGKEIHNAMPMEVDADNQRDRVIHAL